MVFVYDLIEELCIKKGVNVTTLCKDCAIPRSTLTDYKKGSRYRGANGRYYR